MHRIKLLCVVLVSSVLVVGCSLFGDVKTYTLSWDANTESDIWKYDVYMWVGTDTTQSPWYGMGDESLVSGANYGSYYVKTVVHPATSTIFQAESDGINYIQMGVSAIDFSNNESHLGLSKFYLTLDSDAPSAPKNVVVE